MRRAVRGVRRTSFSIPARARATVDSSRKAPICMMNATSPAAKISSVTTDAINAIDTRTSALISNRSTSPVTASFRIGIPHRITATQAASNGRNSGLKKLTTSAAPATTRNRTSRPAPMTRLFQTAPHCIILSSRID